MDEPRLGQSYKVECIGQAHTKFEDLVHEKSERSGVINPPVVKQSLVHVQKERAFSLTTVAFQRTLVSESPP